MRMQEVMQTRCRGAGADQQRHVAGAMEVRQRDDNSCPTSPWHLHHVLPIVPNEPPPWVPIP